MPRLMGAELVRHRWGVRTFRERFDETWTLEPNTGCWLWMNAPDPKGYGRFFVGRIDGRPRQKPAHRVSWGLYRGPIPDGMVIDHLCRVRSCVNPDHLRCVTPAINATENSVSFAARNAAKTHCDRGHPLPAKGPFGRVCAACERRRLHAYRARLRAKRAS